ncbi:uncharacterized protein J3D65DRAFT_626268 [Phyllosticta citribraziliensis]|uniref:Secreted protein n=1 Tax=Phyllosticta citribraziliensis TaxID=989973 RepID=A0ABR1LKT6_9PEZI
MFGFLFACCSFAVGLRLLLFARLSRHSHSHSHRTNGIHPSHQCCRRHCRRGRHCVSIEVVVVWSGFLPGFLSLSLSLPSTPYHFTSLVVWFSHTTSLSPSSSSSSLLLLPSSIIPCTLSMLHSIPFSLIPFYNLELELEPS